MSKKGYKINKGRFALFLIGCIIMIGLITFLVSICIKFAQYKKETKECEHNYINGVCTLCGEECEHSYEDGVCTKCNKQCVHTFENGKCTVCGAIQDPRLSWPNTTTSKNEYPLSKVSLDYLVLVNKQYHLTEDYVPDDLVVVSHYVLGNAPDDMHRDSLRKPAAEKLETLFRDAEAQGIYLKLISGYRSFYYQERLFNNYAAADGIEEANKYSARPGESEHQTGLCCDLGGASQGYALSDYFGDTAEGQWVKDNCWKYGFILRYIDGDLQTPGEHTGYIYEAWHIRYVGMEAAKIIYDNNYTLEEYLEEIAKAE